MKTADMKKYERVSTLIRDMIQAGTLKSGDKIPSLRKLGKQMRLSLMTVTEGYRQLESQGVIESVPQSGYYVRPKAFWKTERSRTLPSPSQVEIKPQKSYVKIPSVIEELLKQASRQDLIRLGAGLPEPEDLPSDELSLHLSRISRTNPEKVNQYIIGLGSIELRREIATLMAENGCVVSSDQIIITSGTTQALLLCLRAVTSPGDTVAVESPGYQGFFALAQFLNLKVVEIPTDPETGISVETLEGILKKRTRLSSLLLSSTCSNPTGATMPELRKQELADLSAQYELPVIEDDTYGMLAFDEPRPSPLKTFSPDTILHIGNFSKILSPGYRISWICAGAHHEDVLRCHNMAALAAPTPNQLALASFLKKNGLNRHLKKLRKKYADNMLVFQEEISRLFPTGTKISHPLGGHFIWVELPTATDSVSLAETAAEKGISLAPGVLFSSHQHYRHFIRLNCAVKWSPLIRRALETIGKLVKAQR